MLYCLVAFGSNLGDSGQIFKNVLCSMESTGLSDVYCSGLLQTEPVGGPAGQPAFYNACVRFSTELNGVELIDLLRNIEAGLGRQRHQRWGPRIVDLDLLLMGDLVKEDPELTIPHPRMSFRRFVLQPAAEIAAEMVHPTSGLTIGELLRRLDEKPDRVVLVTDRGADVSNVIELAGKTCAENDFEFLVSTDSMDAAESKLVVYSVDDNKELVRQAARVPGATLALSGLTIDSVSEELPAALAAMKSL